MPDKLPWWENKTVQLVVPASYVVTSDGDYSRITGDILEEIAPYVGMPVTLNYSGTDHTLVIASYTPHSEAVDGSGGVTASITLAYDTANGCGLYRLTGGLAAAFPWRMPGTGIVFSAWTEVRSRSDGC